jgi:tRNA1Val (adenine37-N6)-methyltransferase
MWEKNRSMRISPSSDETLSTFLEGHLQIIQKKRGYRFSVDALLLSQFATIRKNEKVADLGTGCGIIPLYLSQTTGARSFAGIEIQKGLASLARRNVILNRLQDRIAIHHQDIRGLRKLFPSGSFHVVLSNPPYRRCLAGKRNPSIEKAIARHEIEGTLEEWTATMAYLLPPKGRCYLIYSASRAIDLLVSLRKCGLEPKRLQWVYPRIGEEASFVLTESLKDSGTELRVMPPLILHETIPG